MASAATASDDGKWGVSMPNPTSQALLYADVIEPSDKDQSAKRFETRTQFEGKVDEMLNILKGWQKEKEKTGSKIEYKESQAVYVDVCPYGTIPCDEKKMNALGFQCPREGAPNPVIFDENSNLCLLRQRIAQAGGTPVEAMGADGDNLDERGLQKLYKSMN